MGTERETNLLLTAYRAAWLQPAFMDLLRRRFDVHVMQAQLRGPRLDKTVRVMSKREMVLSELAFFLRLVATPRLYRGDWRIAAMGGHFGTLLFARLLRALGRPRATYMLNLYLHALGEHPLVKRILAFLLTDDVRLIAQSSADAQYFARFLPEGNIMLLPYCKPPSKHVEFSEAEAGDYVFAGGFSNRDYDALFRCAARLPDVPFVVVPSIHSPISEPAPANVTVLFDQEHAVFERLLAKSRFVVIPLRRAVGSSGQMVLLTAMQFGKTALVPDLDAIAQYIDDGRTGVFYPHGNEDALRSRIAELHADGARTGRIGAAARTDYLERFTPQNFNVPAAEYIAGGDMQRGGGAWAAPSPKAIR